jgi:two-component system, OmpR family, phosphate regulon sensor histidine kinase PhoR
VSRYAVKLVIIFGSLAIMGILSVQLFFIKRSYIREHEQLNQSIRIALQQVAENLFDYHESALPYENIIHQVSSNYFIVNINNTIDVKVLEYYLTKEFQSRNLQLDFEYAIYDCLTDKMVYGNYINLSDKDFDGRKEKIFPKWDEYIYYFGIYFPNKNKLLIDNLSIWYFISAILLVVVLFFAYSMFIILRQKRLSEIQKSFIHNITHEFKTPLTSISLSASVLGEKGVENDTERLRKYAQIIKEQAMHLHEQVLKVLQSSTMDNVRLELSLTEFELNGFLQDILNGFEARFKNDNARVTFVPSAQEIIIKADKVHFKNMLINLIDNALKYSEGKPEIEIATMEEMGKHLLSIKDRGIGIDSKYIKRVFDKFFRVPTGNIHNVKGFGLGLSYVKQVVKAHKWKIILQSEPGKGTHIAIKF